MHVCMYICMRVCMYDVWVYVCLQVSMRARMYVYMRKTNNNNNTVSYLVPSGMLILFPLGPSAMRGYSASKLLAVNNFSTKDVNRR